MSVQFKEHYVSQYSALQASLPGTGLPWLNALRKQALDRFSRSGFPSPREEEWRYTNVAPIERKLFSPFVGAASVDSASLARYRVDGAACLVFVDGQFNAALSTVPEPGEDIVICPMGEAMEKHPDLVEKHFGSVIRRESSGFLSFNTALFTDGALVLLPEGMKIDCPLQLLYVSASPDVLSTARNLVVAQPGSQVEIIESYVGLGDAGYLTAAVTELSVADDSYVTWSKLQSENGRAFHFGGLYADVGPNGRLDHSSFSFGGLLVRNEVHVDLADASECSLDGLFLATGRQHVDNHTRIGHRKPHGVSREFYKGILDQRARGVFQGRVIVDQDAQKTDSEMNNRNLLLSSDAEIDTKPQLEIYADDVKCAHGVTVGQIEDESVFYLQSRGVDADAARNMLTFAFANEMVGKIDRPALRSLVQDELLDALPATNLRKEWL